MAVTHDKFEFTESQTNDITESQEKVSYFNIESQDATCYVDARSYDNVLCQEVTCCVDDKSYDQKLISSYDHNTQWAMRGGIGQDLKICQKSIKPILYIVGDVWNTKYTIGLIVLYTISEVGVQILP